MVVDGVDVCVVVNMVSTTVVVALEDTPSVVVNNAVVDRLPAGGVDVVDGAGVVVVVAIAVVIEEVDLLHFFFASLNLSTM